MIKIIKKNNIVIPMLVMIFISLLFVHTEINAAPLTIPKIGIDVEAADTPTEISTSIQMLLTLTVIALAPSILIMMTSFTRIIIVFHFLRSALGTQQTPPNQVLVGLALFLTLFIMTPTLTQVNEEGYQPYLDGEINQEVALERSSEPIKTFMLKQVYEKDLKLFADIANLENSKRTAEDIPFRIVIPSFIIGELKKGFMIGFLLYIPFIVIDMVVASTLMSMGMMMLPPMMISLPFKILLFVLIDGWNLVVGQIIQTFR